MNAKKLGPHDYDELESCPFCNKSNLIDHVDELPGDGCDHFVVAFQDGNFAADLCPPVSCVGFRFRRRQFEAALAKCPEIFLKIKPGTRRHPRIFAYYSADPTLSAKMREKFRLLPVVAGVKCRVCGNETAVISEELGYSQVLCAVCGDSADVRAIEEPETEEN
jgi:transcription elongation factor Elf1